MIGVAVTSAVPLMYGYIGWRLIIAARVASPWREMLWVVLVSLLLVLPLSALCRKFATSRLLNSLLWWIGYLSLGYLSIVFAMLFVRDLTVLAGDGVTKAYGLVRGLSLAAEPSGPIQGYRQILLSSPMNVVILLLAGILAGYGFHQARRHPRIVTVTVPIRNLPDDLEGLRIVQISDIHISHTTPRSFVHHIVAEVNRLEPDVVVFTGDLADDPPAAWLREKAAPLADVCAPLGSYFVTGNHEYGKGREAWVEEISKLGFHVLLNDHRILHRRTARMLLAGVIDYEAGRFNRGNVSSPERALAGAPPSDVKVLLAHQPRSVFDAARVGFDLQVSGHTHGGQFFPWHVLVRLQQPYLAGLHQYEHTWIYVSRGSGCWGPPLRLAAPSEITLLTLSKTGIA